MPDVTLLKVEEEAMPVDSDSDLEEEERFSPSQIEDSFYQQFSLDANRNMAGYTYVGN